MKFSDSTENIFKALTEFRKNIIQPKKEANNPQFRSNYVPLELLTDAIDKVAPNYGLAYFQNLTTVEEYLIGVQTTITHESGEYIVFDWLYLDARPIIKGGGKGNATTQSQGSAITYGRRYSLSSAFGIASEVDDDGVEASGEKADIDQNSVSNEQESFRDTVNGYFRDIINASGMDAKATNDYLNKKSKVNNWKELDNGLMIATLKETLREVRNKNTANK